MTRDDALRRLRGTWTFELSQGSVRIRDEQLLRSIALLRREQETAVERDSASGRERPLAG